MLDASCPTVQAGIWQNGSWLTFYRNHDTALTAVFNGTDAVLNRIQLDLTAITSFLYGEGPGSVLGLRVAAMALRTWNAIQSPARPVYAFNSLHLAAEQLRQSDGPAPPWHLIAESRRGFWNVISASGSGLSPVRELDSTALDGLTGRLFHLPQKKAWARPPRTVTVIDYNLEQGSNLFDASVLRPVENPAAYLWKEPGYKTWTPGIHRPASS